MENAVPHIIASLMYVIVPKVLPHCIADAIARKIVEERLWHCKAAPDENEAARMKR
jgi:hypothetical protein